MLKPFQAMQNSNKRNRLSRIALISAAVLSVSGSLTVLPAYAEDSAKNEVVSTSSQMNPGYYSIRLGDFKITAVSDGTVMVDFTELMNNTSPEEVARLLARRYHGAQVETSINAYVIDTGNHVAIVDTGAGDVFAPSGGHLVENLKSAGYQPEQIDAVLLTHIHGDHSCGLTRNGKMTFPNAVVYADQHDVDFWLNSDNKDKVSDTLKVGFEWAEQSVGTYLKAGRVKAFSEEGELFPGISAINTYGHTPGHTVYQAESQGQRIRFIGDLLHSQDIQFARPEITIDFDLNSPKAARQRLNAFNDAVEGGYLIGAAHIPFPGIGHIQRDGGAFEWIPMNYRAKAN